MARSKHLGSLALWIFLCVGVGAAGGFITSTGDGSWYQTIEKPSFNPPGWVFGPVWTTLYVLMGLAIWSIRRETADKLPLVLFLLQLLLNGIWTPLFFGLEMPALAFIDIVLLWVSIGATIFVFKRYSGFAATLLVPYWLWVSFAAILNATIWYLNS